MIRTGRWTAARMAWITGGAWRRRARRSSNRTGGSCWSSATARPKRLREILEEQKWIVEAVEEDYNHQPRIMVARRANSTADEPGAAGTQPR